MSLVAIRFEKSTTTLLLLDQRRLPSEVDWCRCTNSEDVASAIESMVVRGAPAIAIVAAYGVAIAAARGEDLVAASDRLAASRPTAVNLRWALQRMGAAQSRGADLAEEACVIHREDVEINRRMGRAGADLLEGGVLTICNTGALATGGWGTALGVVRSAREAGRHVHLYVCETRPYDQGSRLTTYECVHDSIPCTLIADSMAGALMASGRVSSVVVGCDRVAVNGDVANKIGTYNLAVLARHHEIPFYVAMPLSTYDPECPDGASIPIELRPASELFDSLAVDVWNPAFDVTPAELVSAWITEAGIRREGPLR